MKYAINTTVNMGEGAGSDYVAIFSSFRRKIELRASFLWVHLLAKKHDKVTDIHRSVEVIRHLLRIDNRLAPDL